MTNRPEFGLRSHPATVTGEKSECNMYYSQYLVENESHAEQTLWEWTGRVGGPSASTRLFNIDFLIKQNFPHTVTLRWEGPCDVDKDHIRQMTGWGQTERGNREELWERAVSEPYAARAGHRHAPKDMRRKWEIKGQTQRKGCMQVTSCHGGRRTGLWRCSAGWEASSDTAAAIWELTGREGEKADKKWKR